MSLHASACDLRGSMGVNVSDAFTDMARKALLSENTFISIAMDGNGCR
jgi:hypothetical protein